jgi:molybdopterin-containing oxidoreductase family iron-sulfur binding subunit
MDRRDFLKAGGILWIGTAGPYGLLLLRASQASTTGGNGSPSTRRWGMVIDLTKCPADCTACLEACRKENNVASHGDKRWDIHWIRKVRIKAKHAAGSPERAVPLLCNHCDRPPCAQVCPVQATYKRADGIVIVDHHRCIGCRYCMIACPYNARYFNYKENHDWPNRTYPKRSHGVAESCHLCAHRLDASKRPACVEACEKHGEKALLVGDLNDPNSEVSRLISNHPVRRLREDLGTEPKVYYLGL